MTLVFFNLFDWFCCLLRFEFTILFFVHFTDKLNQLNHRSIDLNWHCWFDCYRRCCFVFFSYSYWWLCLYFRTIMVSLVSDFNWLIDPLQSIEGYIWILQYIHMMDVEKEKHEKGIEMDGNESWRNISFRVHVYFILISHHYIEMDICFFRVNLMGCIWSLETWKCTPKGKNFFQFTRSICCIIFKSNNFAILLFCRLFRLPFSSWKMIYGFFCLCLIYHHHHYYYLDNGKHVQNLITILY